MDKSEELPEELLAGLYHGQEEVYLEYKGDVPWTDQAKKLEIVKTIFAMANERDGGLIIIGVKDDGSRNGLSEENYNSFSHDQINSYLANKGNQPIQCKVEKKKHTDKDDGKERCFIFIQVSETKEFPLVYTGEMILINSAKQAFPENIGLRRGCLYIRNKLQVGNKEIETNEEWQELIERTYKKYERETLKRYSVVSGQPEPDNYENELSI